MSTSPIKERTASRHGLTDVFPPGVVMTVLITRCPKTCDIQLNTRAHNINLRGAMPHIAKVQANIKETIFFLHGKSSLFFHNTTNIKSLYRPIGKGERLKDEIPNPRSLDYARDDKHERSE
jgi:hypothetical protein